MRNSKIVEALPWLLVVGSVAVIMGCLFKLQHWPCAAIMLVIGLTLEAIGVPLMILYLWKNRSAGGSTH